MKIIPINNIVSQKNINKHITLQEFKRLRKRANIDIEKYIYQERYSYYNQPLEWTQKAAHHLA